MQILGLIFGLSLTWLSQAIPTEAGLRRSVPSRDALNQSATNPPLTDIILRGLQSLGAQKGSGSSIWVILCNSRDSLFGNSPSDFNLVYINAPLLPPSTSISVGNNGTNPLEFHVTGRNWLQDGVDYMRQKWRYPSSASLMTPDEAFDLVARRANFPPPYSLVSIYLPSQDPWGSQVSLEIVYKFDSMQVPTLRLSAVVGTISRRTLVLNQTLGTHFIDNNRRV